MGNFQKKIKGYFFEETTITLGTGHTQKTQKVKNYCAAEQTDEETVEVKFLGNDGQPTGIVVKLPYDEFLKKYTFEPDFKVKTKDEREHDKHLARAEKHRGRGEVFSAEMEYTTALKIDPESIKANFGIGTLYMEMGQTNKAKAVFQKLSQIEAIFEEDNKHIFNEFGIELRKARMNEEALANYLKALQISPNDENLYFNIARLYHDAKDLEYALMWIEKSVAVNPLFRDAKLFAGVIRKEMLDDIPSEGDEAPKLQQVDPETALSGVQQALGSENADGSDRPSGTEKEEAPLP